MVLGGALMTSCLFAARAAADALPHDPVTGKSINGYTILLDLEDYPEYTFLLFNRDCFDPERPDDDERKQTLGGAGSKHCTYELLRSNNSYAGVSYDSPNVPSPRFAALPAKQFPAKDGRIPALDRITLATLYAWLDEEDDDSPLIDLGAPPEYVELHRFSMFGGFTRYERPTVRCGVLSLEEVRTEWDLVDGGFITQPARPAAPPECEPEPGDAPEPPDAPPVQPEPQAPAEPPAPAVAEPADASSPPVAPPAPPPSRDTSEQPAPQPPDEVSSSATSGLRELVLGGVSLLVGLGAGLMLSRRPKPRA
jgi:hypothetical protein